MGNIGPVAPYRLVNTQSLNVASFNSNAMPILQESCFGVQLNWTGTPTGNFSVSVSNDHVQEPGGQVITAGTFIPLNLSPTPAAAGSASNAFVNVQLLAGAYLQVGYTNTGNGQQTVTTVHDVAGSLAGAYFLIQTEGSAHKYALWFKVSGTGSAPSVAGYTNEEVDISTGDTAGTVASDLASVMNGLTGMTASATGSVVTVTNSVAGPIILAVDGATPTAFTFALTVGTGNLDVYIVNKNS